MNDFKLVQAHFSDGITEQDINLFDTMDKALLLKYWFILDMQFYAFEELSEHKLTAKDIVYASGEVFVGNEAEYLKLANGLMELYPIKEKLDELIETKYTKEEFDSLYDDACEEYKKLINLID